MEYVFKYKCVKEICREVSEVLEMDIQSVHPVANYDQESKPSFAKNSMALMALWDIFKCGERNIRQQFDKQSFFGDDY